MTNTVTTRSRDEIPSWAYRLACLALIGLTVYFVDDRLKTIDARLSRIEVVLFIPAIHAPAPLAEK